MNCMNKAASKPARPAPIAIQITEVRTQASPPAPTPVSSVPSLLPNMLRKASEMNGTANTMKITRSIHS